MDIIHLFPATVHEVRVQTTCAFLIFFSGRPSQATTEGAPRSIRLLYYKYLYLTRGTGKSPPTSFVQKEGVTLEGVLLLSASHTQKHTTRCWIRPSTTL